MVSESLQGKPNCGCRSVLILVLVEDGLRDKGQPMLAISCKIVLILVLVEDGLRVQFNNK